MKGKLYFKENIKLSGVAFKKSTPYDYIKTDPQHNVHYVVVKDGYVIVDKQHIEKDTNEEPQEAKTGRINRKTKLKKK